MISLVEPCATQKVTWWLGETGGFWIQTGALLVSALGAVLIILSRSKTERKRATVDLVLQLKKDTDLTNARRTILKLHNAGQKHFAPFLADADCPEHQAIMRVLNTNEFVAGGIKNSAYDEKLYKRMQCSSFIRDWEAFSGFVMDFRNSRGDKDGAKTFYQDFQWLAERWRADPLKPSRPSFIQRIFQKN